MGGLTGWFWWPPVVLFCGLRHGSLGRSYPCQWLQGSRSGKLRDRASPTKKKEEEEEEKNKSNDVVVVADRSTETISKHICSSGRPLSNLACVLADHLSNKSYPLLIFFGLEKKNNKKKNMIIGSRHATTVHLSRPQHRIGKRMARRQMRRSQRENNRKIREGKNQPFDSGGVNSLYDSCRSRRRSRRFAELLPRRESCVRPIPGTKFPGSAPSPAARKPSNGSRTDAEPLWFQI